MKRRTGLKTWLLVLVFVVASLAPLSAGAFHSEYYGNSYFHDVWGRTDEPVFSGQTNRTWMWGPEPFSGLLSEAYAEGAYGERIVQYYDKTRMEITDPSADRGSDWFVTNGLLAKELVTGEMQVGHSDFLSYWPSEIPVAGDADDVNGPTYASFGATLHLRNADPPALLTTVIEKSGNLYDLDDLAIHAVGVSEYVPDTGQWVAEPFWEFMNSSGMVLQDGSYTNGALFESPYYATGLPISGAFWADVKVGGANVYVLIQVFERRVLTYTPGNPAGWQVEAGNVGRHYFNWRYNEIGDDLWEPLPEDTGAMNITYINAVTFNNQDATGEFVRIFNNDIGPIDMTGWILEDSDGNGMIFPELVVWPGESVAVYVCDTGGGDGDHIVYWGACYEIWDNFGETAYLYDAAGRVMSEYWYTN